MKNKIVSILLAVAATSVANAAVTLSFSNATNWLSDFQNGSGSSLDTVGIAGQENRLVWGILVDGGRDGFDGASATNPYAGGFSLAANTAGLALNLHNSTATDDVLYIASAVMASSTAALANEGPAGINRILTFTGLNFNATLGSGEADPYAIIWFDALALSGTANNGMKYGIFQLPAAINTLPPDGTNASTYPSQFAGVDSSKTMDFTLGTPIPETSTSLLGAIGALALLRRRRN